MIFLAIHVMCTVGFSQVLRFAQRCEASIPPLLALSYLVSLMAAGVGGAFGTADRFGGLAYEVLSIGAIGGLLLYGLARSVLLSYEEVGVGVTGTLIQAASIVPVLVSCWLWGETISVWGWVGVLILPVALVLMQRAESQQRRAMSGLGIGALVFMISGVLLCLHKYVAHSYPAMLGKIYTVGLFAAATCMHFIQSMVFRWKVGKRDVGLALCLGGLNWLVMISVLRGLEVVPGRVFFPIASSLIVAGMVLSSWALWAESVSSRQACGLVVLAAVAVLSNLG